ncbi:MAG: SAM-dependent methyltransferase [Peptostreptococcaceae bacterium]|nr:SAM-dependent methyltransferase [Peptostreptococcaceae bacterium]
MIKLSERLEIIANLIDENETMADIGTDHGFLPIALWERGICKKIILSDINKGPLEKASENIKATKHGIEFDLRLGNGLETILPREVSTLVIAGMGGALITEILAADLEKSKSFEKIILQPRNGQSKLRYWLLENGFNITKEELVKEGLYICEIIVAKPIYKESNENISWLGINFELPGIEMIKGNQLIREFVEKKIKTEKKIINKIISGGNKEFPLNNEKILRSEGRIIFMEKYLEKVDEKNGNHICGV